MILECSIWIMRGCLGNCWLSLCVPFPSSTTLSGSLCGKSLSCIDPELAPWEIPSPIRTIINVNVMPWAEDPISQCECYYWEVAYHKGNDKIKNDIMRPWPDRKQTSHGNQCKRVHCARLDDDRDTSRPFLTICSAVESVLDTPDFVCNQS